MKRRDALFWAFWSSSSFMIHNFSSSVSSLGTLLWLLILFGCRSFVLVFQSQLNVLLDVQAVGKIPDPRRHKSASFRGAVVQRHHGSVEFYKEALWVFPQVFKDDREVWLLYWAGSFPSFSPPAFRGIINLKSDRFGAFSAAAWWWQGGGEERFRAVSVTAAPLSLMKAECVYGCLSSTQSISKV